MKEYYQVARMIDGSYTLQKTPLVMVPREVEMDELRRLKRNRPISFAHPIFVATTSLEYIYDEEIPEKDKRFHFDILPVLCLGLVYWDYKSKEFLMVLAGHSMFKLPTGGNCYSDIFSLRTMVETPKEEK